MTPHPVPTIAGVTRTAPLLFPFLLPVLLLLAVAGFGGVAGPGTAHADVAGSPTGVWRTANGRSHIRIYACGAALCGRIVWLEDPLDARGEPVRDSNNPDPELRSRTILGLRILSGLTPNGADGRKWTDGRVYNPQDGRTYGSRITLLGPDRLEMRGYLGVPLLGGGEVWTRVE